MKTKQEIENEIVRKAAINGETLTAGELIRRIHAAMDENDHGQVVAMGATPVPVQPRGTGAAMGAAHMVINSEFKVIKLRSLTPDKEKSFKLNDDGTLSPLTDSEFRIGVMGAEANEIRHILEEMKQGIEQDRAARVLYGRIAENPNHPAKADALECLAIEYEHIALGIY